MSSDAVILGMIAGGTVTILSASANHGGTISAPGFLVKQLDRVFEKVQIQVLEMALRQTGLETRRFTKNTLNWFFMAEIPFSVLKR